MARDGKRRRMGSEEIRGSEDEETHRGARNRLSSSMVLRSGGISLVFVFVESGPGSTVLATLRR
jgi:hypothetical protein